MFANPSTHSLNAPPIPAQTPPRSLISEAEQRAQERRRVSLGKRFCLCSPCQSERQAQPGWLSGWLELGWGER